jgi:nucleotide-binding universal stress UspA family protein
MSTNRKSLDTSGGTSGLVVVGVHGSPSALRALRHAARIALDRDWDLEIVTAWPDADDPFIHDVPGRYMVARGHAMDCQRQALAALASPEALRVETFLLNARPAQALIARCDDADLLVVGASRPGHRGDRRGVAAECVEAASCPVTVVPDPSEQPVRESGTTSLRRQERHGRARRSKAGTAANA